MTDGVYQSYIIDIVNIDFSTTTFVSEKVKVRGISEGIVLAIFCHTGLSPWVRHSGARCSDAVEWWRVAQWLADSPASCILLSSWCYGGLTPPQGYA
eukprot:6188140-Pleurochrysis_carterae.AAC.2